MQSATAERTAAAGQSGSRKGGFGELLRSGVGTKELDRHRTSWRTGTGRYTRHG